LGFLGINSGVFSPSSYKLSYMSGKHLSTEFLNEITHRLVTALEPEQIFLFGSYAYGEPTEDSDVDRKNWDTSPVLLGRLFIDS
jgi:hypothetical protein